MNEANREPASAPAGASSISAANRELLGKISLGLCVFAVVSSMALLFFRSIPLERMIFPYLSCLVAALATGILSRNTILGKCGMVLSGVLLALSMLSIA